MTTIRFHLRPGCGKNGYDSRFFIRVIHKRQYRDILRDMFCASWEWSQIEQRVLYPVGDPRRRTELKELQRGIREEQQRLESIVASLADHGEYTVGDIVDRFLLKDTGLTLIAYSRTLEARLISAGRERTARAYHSAARSIVEFNNGEDIPLSRLSQPLVESYEEYLLGKGLQMNTVSFYMRNLRAIYYKAVGEGAVTEQSRNPFTNVYTGVHQTKRRSLDQEDIQALAKLCRSLEISCAMNEQAQPPVKKSVQKG